MVALQSARAEFEIREGDAEDGSIAAEFEIVPAMGYAAGLRLATLQKLRAAYFQNGMGR